MIYSICEYLKNAYIKNNEEKTIPVLNGCHSFTSENNLFNFKNFHNTTNLVSYSLMYDEFLVVDLEKHTYNYKFMPGDMAVLNMKLAGYIINLNADGYKRDLDILIN